MGYAPWLILSTVILYGIVHSLLASLAVKAGVRRRLGAAYDRYYRLFYNLFAVLSFLPVLWLLAVLPDRRLYTIPFPWSLLAFALQAVGGLLVIAGVWQTGTGSFFGLRQLVRPDEDREPELVVRGVYRCIRHPLYTGGLLFIWLLPVMTVNLLFLNLGLSLYLIVGAMVEERKLVHEFGERYHRYRRSTPMLFPGLRHALRCSQER